jgi:hypothetical protein
MGNAYNNASLLVTPNGYKASKIYSAKPTDGSGDLAFSRASTAMRRNSAGLWEEVANNVPRLQYPLGGGCPSWLFEPQATNLDPNSATFASWDLNNSGGVTVSNVSTSTPFQGVNTAVKVIPNAVSGQHRPLIFTNYSAAGFVWGIFKADGYNFISFGEAGGVSGGDTIFDLSNGTISSTGSASSPFIISMGNGWYMCGILTNSIVMVSRWIVVRNANNTNDYVGDGTSGILCCHKQLEAGSVATSPIITAGSAVTRLADVASKTSATALIGQTEGTIFFDVTIGGSLNDSTGKVICAISDGTSDNIIVIYRYNNLIYYDNIVGGAVQFSNSVFTITSFNTRLKGCVNYKLNSVKSFINGALTNTDTNALIPACSRFDEGNERGLFSYNGLIDEVILYKTAISDSEAIELTQIV